MTPTRIAACVLLTLGTACSADELIITTDGGLVQSIDLDSGVVGFRGTCTGQVRSMAVADGTLYLGSPNGSIYVYDLASDLIVDSFNVDADNSAMAWLGDQLVVGDTDRRLLYIDPAKGEAIDTVDFLGTDITTVGVDAGGLYIGGHSTLALRAPLGGTSFQFFAACGSMINAMAFSANTMFLAGTHFGTPVGTVYKFNKFVGGVDYSGTFDAPNNAQAVLAYNGLLYVGGSNGTVHEMNPDTGAVVRSFNISSPVTGIAPRQGLVSCPADYDISGSLNFFDVGQFLSLFNQHLPAGDLNGDGAFNFFDVDRFLDLYNSGCP